MYNLPVKFSVLSSRYEYISPQFFLDEPPERALMIYKSILPPDARQVLEFTMSDEAILLLLETEFEAGVSKSELQFVKPSLDAESWLHVNGFVKKPDPTVDDFSIATFKSAIMTLVRPFLTESDRHFETELDALIYLFLHRYPLANHSLLDKPPTQLILQFLNLVVADAMFKGDAARVLFGREAMYSRLWVEKQRQFYRIVHALEFPDILQIA